MGNLMTPDMAPPKKLVVEPTQLKNMLIKLDDFPKQE